MTIKKIIQAAVITLAAFSILGCSSSYHLKRAIAKDPSIVTEKVDTFYLPEVSIDTFFVIDTNGIEKDLDSIFITVSDDCEDEVKALIPVISHYIGTRDIITDTLTYHRDITTDSLIINLIAKVWQDGTKIHLILTLEKALILRKNVDVVYKEKSSIKDRIRMILFSIGMGLVAFFIIKKLLK